jgi:hypothetical protein
MPTAHLNGRRAAHKAVSSRLLALDDRTIAAQLRRAERFGSGRGTRLLEVEGIPVFVKTIALTDIERSTGNVGSTANLFELPLYYQYGIGSMGFGAWRELAANTMATDWVLTGACVNFPLLYHWRVLPLARRRARTPKQQAALDRDVDYWNGSAAIRARLEALSGARANLVLFLEYFPKTLDTWAAEHRAAGAEAAQAAIVQIDDQLNAVTRFTNAHGMLHFDLHFHNVLTDGEQIFVTDFGLATCSGFALSSAEREFFDRHQFYDQGYVAAYLAHRIETLQPPASLTPAAAAMIERHGPTAAIFGDFWERLRRETRTTPYPATALAHAIGGPLAL